MANRRRRLSNGVAGALIVLITIVPCGVLGLGIWFALQPSQIEQPVSAVTMTVSKESFWDEQSVTIGVTWSDGAALVAPVWDGIVTELAVMPGSTVSNGTKVLQIDGVWRIAAASAAPFFRSVSEDSGKVEVSALNALLGSLGYSNGGDRWNRNTTLGIRQLAQDLGVPDAKEVDSFDPGWVVWLPGEALVVNEILTAPGHSAPALGEDVAKGAPRISSLDVASTDEIPLPDASSDGWVLTVENVSIPYTGPRITGQADLAAASTSLAASRPEQLTGKLQRAEAVIGWQVPSSAVYIDRLGEVCVFRAAKAEWIPMDVVANGGTLGAVRVNGELTEANQILVNPGEIVRDTLCN